MWRFWNSIPRAFRQHHHGPRASVGVHVEDSEQECSTNQELYQEKCEIKDRLSHEPSGHIINSNCCKEKVSEEEIPKEIKQKRSLVDSIFLAWEERRFIFGNYNNGRGERTNQDGREKWWKSCRCDFCAILGRDHFFEILTVGSCYVWGSETSKLTAKKKNLLYRVLFSLANGENAQHILGNESHAQIYQPVADSSKQTVKENDAKVHTTQSVDSKANNSPESLESALNEFQEICQEYSSKSESLQGLEAARNGQIGVACQHLKKACSMGNISACFNIGLCYEIGSGVPQDLDKAVYYYEKAANSGHRQAKYNLGLIYLNTDYNTKDSIRKRGMALIEEAADGGLVEAQTQMGIFCMEQEKLDVASKYFKAAAEQNDCEAQYFLAMCYEQGLGVELNAENALQMFSLAASAGHEGAIYNLAVYHELGLGELAADSVAAVDLYKKAADAGHSLAQRRLEELESEKIKKQHQEEMRKLNIDIKESSAGSFKKSSSTRSSLSPSASSPDLKSHHNDMIPFFFSSMAGHDVSHQLSSICGIEQQSPRRKNGGFYIGEDDDETLEDFVAMKSLGWSLNMKTVGKGDLSHPELFYPMYGHFHKSYTSPNFVCYI